MRAGMQGEESGSVEEMAQRPTRGQSEGGTALSLSPSSAYESHGGLGHPHSPTSVPADPLTVPTNKGHPRIRDVLLLLLSK